MFSNFVEKTPLTLPNDLQLFFSLREPLWKEQYKNYLRVTIRIISSVLMLTTNLPEKSHSMVGNQEIWAFFLVF